MKTNARVRIPDNAVKLIVLIDDILKKETALGADSILSADEKDELLKLRAIAAKAEKTKSELEKQAENETKKRDLALGTAKGQTVNTPGTARFMVTYLRDILLAKNKTNPKALGEWGFTVDDSPRAKKKDA